MTEQQRRMMGAPSIKGPVCPFCGRPSQNRHHVVPRSQGGAKGPTVDVCGLGNASGCHGLLHSHVLHLDWDEERGWRYLRTAEPTKDHIALGMEGWKELRHVELP